ncbi:protein kinase [Chitinispirillales bacterium ANBcel5]|uniref:protein kinase domain-containing protein n=1 Tax=Cellulosispirillum alkaliphilum TaxID=3039283 RepID=UPI002A563D22|nr:protein kinase [Chitinispirillales bacterium ANBcel5]
MIRNKTTEIIPDSIGNYKILSKIGGGGMGDIYKALQEPLKRTVALKVLPPQFSRDTEFAKRFEIEAKAISLLQHQNIVSIFEYGEDDGYSFFAMQYVDGKNLESYIAERRSLSIQEIVDLAKQICRGLRYAHNNNIIHRDIKPQNILLDKKGIVRITDFGIAKIFTGTGITMTGSAVGTPEYMSPEQAQGKKLDMKTDIYSLGVVIYELLTRRPPFTANNSMAVAYKQVHELPVPPSLKRKDTPKRLELIILKALKKDKRDRYDSIEEMLNHLDSVDISERVEHTTVQFRIPSIGAKDKGAKTYTDQRITDRRSGDRRGYNPYKKNWLFDKRYWLDMAKTQWLTWLMLAGLGVAFLLHILNH